MIESLKIKNFKCFKDCEIKNLSRVNLIGGKNNVGKSTLLEALFLFLGFPQAGLARISASRYVDQNEPLDAEEIWGSSFYSKNHKNPIQIECEQTSKITSIKISWEDVFNPMDNPNFQNVWAQQSNQKQLIFNTSSKMLLMEYKASEYSGNWQEIIYNGAYIQPIPHKNPAHVLSRPPYLFIRAQAPYAYEQMKFLFEKLLEKKKEETLVSFLKKIDPRIQTIMPYKKTLMLDLKDHLNRVPLHYMGEGMQRAMLFYLAIASCPNGVVLIDEIENGLHYSIMKNIFTELQQAAIEFNCQIFATTHSYECIKAAEEGFQSKPDDLRYMRLNRFNDEILVTTYSTDGFVEAIEADREVR